MKSKNTIFHHLFVRMMVVLLGISIAFSFALMPIYHKKLVRILATQGNTFANTTIAACGKTLYTRDYSFLITYINEVLLKTPEITYVDFIAKDGLKLHLTAQGWKVETVTQASKRDPLTEEASYTILHSSDTKRSDVEDVFIFSKPVNITGLDWGSIELGISDAEYDAFMSSYFRNTLLFSIILLIISLLVLRGFSMKLGLQLTKLRETTLELSDGDLAARAPSKSIKEIQLLATTLNSMADNLEFEILSMRQLAKLVENTNDAIAIFDAHGIITFVNTAFTQITNHAFEFYKGMTLQDLFAHLGIEKKKQREMSAGMTHIEQLNWSTDMTISPSGRSSHVTLRIEAFNSEGSENKGFFIVLSNIARRKQLEFELETLSFIDKLTMLPNRHFFMDRLHEAVKEVEVFDSGLAVFFLDLDNFKLINDSLGHDIGDFVLSEAAWRIQDALRSDDIVCRLGGDEFTVIIKGVSEKDELVKIANSMIRKFAKPIDGKDRELRISTSIGIVQFPDDGRDEKELIKNADAAMYAAKHAGKNAFRFFTQDMHRNLHECVELEGALREAIENSELYLVYQPMIDVETQTITNCEALLRWKHPERGQIPPAQFIPIAEQSGLISDIGDWVFTEVCKQLKRWKFDMNVSINVSGDELLDERFTERLKNTLVEYDIEAYRLQLEFTEHVLVSKNGGNLTALNALKKAGFRITIDDFGTKFPSLSHLSELPADAIKIDKSFTGKLPHDQRTIAAVNSIISLADSLDILTIGEGAEDKSQVEWLRAHGCNTIQGYYFHKPLLAQELEQLMATGDVSRLPVAQ
jgi:diguanylate cyclase (GGDEF)-like protein/PAS domain S-box-containing protein